jgi:hypothetical protein
MKHWIVLLIAIAALAAGWLLRSLTLSKSPMTEAAHRKFDQHLKNITSTAESMPAKRYGYAPADGDKYFLEVAQQAIEGMGHRCAQLLNLKIPDFSKALGPIEERPRADVVPEQFKSTAIKQLKDFTDICDQTFGLLNDAQLNELVISQGDHKVTKAEVLMDLLGEVSEAESKMDMYLQLYLQLQASAASNPKEPASRIAVIPSSSQQSFPKAGKP